MMNNFKNVARLMDSQLASLKHLCFVLDLHKVWAQETWRQSYPGTAHGDTETVYFKMPTTPASREVLFNDLTSEWRKFTPLPVQDIDWMVRNYYGADIGRVMLVKLLPGGKVAPHIDEGDYAKHFNRLHVVVNSAEGNWFRCRDEIVKMKEGEVWCFNHQLEHEVGNPTESPRIHLIIDYKKPTESKHWIMPDTEQLGS